LRVSIRETRIAASKEEEEEEKDKMRRERRKKCFQVEKIARHTLGKKRRCS
jgi:hypothetical protein